MRWVAPPIVEHAQGTVGLLDRHDEGRVVGGEGPPKADDEGGPHPPIGGRAQGAIGLLHRVPQGGGCRPPLFFSRGSLGADRVAPLLHCQPRHLEVLPASRLGRLERPIEPLPLRFSRSPRMGSRTCAPASSLRAYIPATLRTIKELALLRRSGRQEAPRWRLHERVISPPINTSGPLLERGYFSPFIRSAGLRLSACHRSVMTAALVGRGVQPENQKGRPGLQRPPICVYSL